MFHKLYEPMRSLLLQVLFFAVFSCCGAQSLFINEFMSSNSSYLSDEDGDYSDWIELYNGSSETVQLSNYSLSDDDDDLWKWTFPDTILSSGEFMVVFASGKNRVAPGNELHTNFGINSEGEFLFLSQNDDINQVVVGVELEPNKSFGLFPDGSSNPVYFDFPTPGSPNSDTQVPEVFFSQNGGYYSSSFSLELSSEQSDANIYYTIDGQEPSTTSLNYSDPLFLDLDKISPANINQIEISPPGFYYPSDQAEVPRAIVLRAAVFDQSGDRISEIATHTYFIQFLGSHIPELPVVSLCGNHEDFFDYDTGILVPGVNWNPDYPMWSGNYFLRGDVWERSVNIEFFEEGENHINQRGGIRTHGGNGRRFAQKGLRLYARSEYGNTQFSHAFFDTKPSEEYKRLVLKPFSSSWSQAGIEDQITSLLASDLDLDFVGSRPVVLYLNGEYWGIYFLQERIDARYIENNYPVDKECVDMMDSWTGSAFAGSNSDFSELYEFIENNDLSVQSNFEYVTERIDVDNFIDYQLFKIFIANYDWPANNMKCWKSECFENKWRWIFFDGDGALWDYQYLSFDHAMSTSNESWPTNEGSTLFFRKLLENDQFLQQFFDRLETLVQNQLSYELTSQIYNDVRAEVEDELVFQTDRFQFPMTLEFGIEQMEDRDSFLSNRPCEFILQAEDKFGVDLTDCVLKSINATETPCGIRTYPNPSSGMFYLHLPAEIASEATIHVADLMGRNVYKSSRNLQPGVSSLRISDEIDSAQGLYIITITSGNCTYQTKQLFIK
jgi:hypothetical protein